MVYNSGIKFTALGLDVATHFDVNLTDDDMEKLEQSPNKEAWFLRSAIKFVNGRGFEAYCTVIVADLELFRGSEPDCGSR